LVYSHFFLLWIDGVGLFVSWRYLFSNRNIAWVLPLVSLGKDMSIEAMKKWLEALENSVDLVIADAYNAEQLYGKYPSRQARVGGLKLLADEHQQAITSLSQAIAEAEKPELMVEVEGVMMPLTQACLLELYKFQEATGCNTADEITKQEPVAEVTSETGAEITMSWWHEPALPIGTKLYTTPQQRKPLTDEQIKKSSLEAGMQEHYMDFHSGFIRFARAIETAHGIKE
jgi:hypothetical protein